MDRCPELQSIGQLSGWVNFLVKTLNFIFEFFFLTSQALTPDDLALLRGMLKSANSCLVLSPTNVFP